MELLQRARAGDRDAFTELVAPHRGELRAHCYRMLGSTQDAEDTVQEALLSAWVGLPGFEGRSSVRTWLFRVATNQCLSAIRAASRRPPAATARPGDVSWLQPFPDLLLDGLPHDAPGPEARYESREAISLAFVTAVQLLPPNQRAALLLRDVLGFRAAETADLLGLSEEAVSSALRRARASVEASRARGLPPPAPGDARERALVDRFVAAFTAGDVEAIIALMTDDVWLRMPPRPLECHGVDAVRAFLATIEGHRREIGRMVAVRANRQPGWGEYVADPVTGGLRLTGVLVADLAGDRIGGLTRFESAVGPWFGLPRLL